ncbi:hypothetical protein D7S86_12365 [Pararobbsia silviterrae]|uniref:Uncharacterized protein n=1 Tax=Pararobbsia silviterrae TaxID=1792498 RepID=A0A494XZP4_9BURK|nr:hypothetical protein D7S86_12365 [Pararobbsia silviterrae]
MDRTLHIDRLTIDLGQISLDRLESLLRERCLKMFEAGVRDRIDRMRDRFDVGVGDEGEEVFDASSRRFEAYLRAPDNTHRGALIDALRRGMHTDPGRWRRVVADSGLLETARRNLVSLVGEVELANLMGWSDRATPQRVLLESLRYAHEHDIAIAPPERGDVMSIDPSADTDIARTVVSRHASRGLQPWVDAIRRQPRMQGLSEMMDKATQGASNPMPAQSMSDVAPQVRLVANAGLVTLWPLLPDLFRRLGLYEDGRFTSSEAQVECALWLDWIALGDVPLDGQMSVARFLCGVSEDVLLPERVHADHMREAAEQWLSTAVRQLPGWRTLRIEDICRFFLRRPGMLSVAASGPMLEVPSQAFDILLADWPWPLNALTLPWLPQPWSIEWSMPDMDVAEGSPGARRVVGRRGKPG